MTFGTGKEAVLFVLYYVTLVVLCYGKLGLMNCFQILTYVKDNLKTRSTILVILLFLIV